MNIIKIWHNNNCSKSKEAKEILERQNVPHRTFEYLKDNFTTDEIKNIIKMLDISDIKDMLRKKEPEYKELDINNKSQKDIIELLILYPKLIQRPIIIKDGKAIIARPMKNLIKLLEK
jgi:arsenate reductase